MNNKDMPAYPVSKDLIGRIDAQDLLQIEAMARAIWNYYYPHGGSIYRSYDELREQDKELHRNEARQVAALLDGDAALTKQPVDGDRS